MKNNFSSFLTCVFAALLLANCNNTPKPVANAPEVTPSKAIAPPDPKDIIDILKVDPTDVPVYKVDAEGDQVYVYDSIAPGKMGWKFDRPDALLYDEQKVLVGKHGKGPYWESNDGSIVVGNGDKASVKKDTTHAGAIDWLLLVQKEHKGNPNGVFSHVSKIHRLYTEGGLKPAETKEKVERGTEKKVYYKATYYFYETQAPQK